MRTQPARLKSFRDSPKRLKLLFKKFGQLWLPEGEAPRWRMSCNPAQLPSSKARPSLVLLPKRLFASRAPMSQQKRRRPERKARRSRHAFILENDQRRHFNEQRDFPNPVRPGLGSGQYLPLLLGPRRAGGDHPGVHGRSLPGQPPGGVRGEPPPPGLRGSPVVARHGHHSGRGPPPGHEGVDSGRQPLPHRLRQRRPGARGLRPLPPEPGAGRAGDGRPRRSPAGGARPVHRPPLGPQPDGAVLPAQYPHFRRRPAAGSGGGGERARGWGAWWT